MEADPLYLRSFEIGEKTLGPDHPHLATQLHNRAGLLTKQVGATGIFQEFTTRVYREYLCGDPHFFVVTICSSLRP